MSQEFFFRGLFSGIYGLVFAWVVFSRYDTEIGSESTDSERQKYLPYLPGCLLPLFIGWICLAASFYYGLMGAAQLTLSMCFGIFLQISLYYAVLIPLLPLLRRYISARACAMLWVIPNYLYITSQRFMELPSPKIVIHAPGNIAWIIFFIWLIGSISVLTWKTIEHLVFRRNILRNCSVVSDPNTLAVWDKVIAEARIQKPKFKLVHSSHDKSPLSVGLFQRTMKVILPEQAYSLEELELILRHEIIHIAREDSWSKYFLVFCTAMCWFNPLMWIAMRKSAEDIELSCDETVLLDADEYTRKRYASLLLDTAGDERGFTTCLSASANAMRYRLRSITKPAKRRSGAMIVGLTFFLLCMTSGYIALAYGDHSGAELIYQNRDSRDYRLRHVSMADDTYHRNYEIVDEEAFHEYLSSLKLSELTGNYSFSDSDTKFNYMMDTPEETLAVLLHSNFIKITPLFGEHISTEHYYIYDGVDWGYINKIIVPHPALNLHLDREGDLYGKDVSARLDLLWKTVDGEKQLIYDAGYPEDEIHGIVGYDPFDMAKFSFSKTLTSPCTVQIESWDRSKSDTVMQENLSEPFVLKLPPHPAHYTICASFNDQNGNRYDAQFRFDIGDMEQ